MTNHLKSLQSRRAELLQRIARIDELIMEEIDDVLSGNESGDRQRGLSGGRDATEGGMSSGANTRHGSAENGVSGEQNTRKTQKAASTYPAGVRTWSDKILYTLNNAGGRGMSTGEIMKALKSAEGDQGSRVVPATINTTLQAMESKAKSIRAERGPTGRKLHYAADAAEGSASGTEQSGS
jgi:hypothetical protein